MDYLLDAYRDEDRNRISMSMVYSPPFSEDKIDRIASLWDEPWLSRETNFSFSYVQRDAFMGDLGGPPERDYSALNWTIKNYIEHYRRGEKPHPLASQFLDKKLALLHQRPLCRGKIVETGLNACCVPGVRKIFVTANGTMQLCERVGNAPNIGDVYSGINVENIKRIFISEYRTKSETQCSYCWCARLCEICYVQAYRNGEFSVQQKQHYCEVQKRINEIFLGLYCRLLEINPRGLDHLLKMEMV